MVPKKNRAQKHEYKKKTGTPNEEPQIKKTWYKFKVSNNTYNIFKFINYELR